MMPVRTAPAPLLTERLVLRQPAAADIDAIVEALGDFDVVKNLARVPWPYERRHAEEFLARAETWLATDAERVFVIDDGRLCGLIGVRDYRSDGPAHIGYWLARPAWGKGYATEAVRALVDYAFHDLPADALVAEVVSDNPASMRVLEKAGFARVGESSCATLSRGELPAVYYRLERADWRAR